MSGDRYIIRDQHAKPTLGANETVTYNKDLTKPIMDSIDTMLAQHYGFTEEELDFIINYDIKCRMGKELNNGEGGDK